MVGGSIGAICRRAFASRIGKLPVEEAFVSFGVFVLQEGTDGYIR